MQVSLLYASNSMKDVLLKSSLDTMAAGSDGKFKVSPYAPECAHTSQLYMSCHAHEVLRGCALSQPLLISHLLGHLACAALNG